MTASAPWAQYINCTFRRRPECHLNILCTYSLCPVSRVRAATSLNSFLQNTYFFRSFLLFCRTFQRNSSWKYNSLLILYQIKSSNRPRLCLLTTNLYKVIKSNAWLYLLGELCISKSLDFKIVCLTKPVLRTSLCGLDNLRG